MIGDFIIKQILGMKWLNELIGGLLSAIGVDLESRLGGGIHFFLYDVIKITENGSYTKAVATEEDYDAIGIVSEIINENEFIITTHGQIDYEFVSVSDSTVLYLSDSEPGKLVTYEDITTKFYTPIGFINGDKMMINIMDSSTGNTLKKYQEQLFNQELTYLSQEDIIEVYNEVYNS